MTRRPGRVAATLALLLAAPATALLPVVGAGAGVGGWGWCLEAADATTGAVLARPALPTDGAFALRYRHSYYRAPAVERLAVDRRGRLVTVALASPSLAVLDYYGRPERPARRPDGSWEVRLSSSAGLARLPVLATPVGRRTLEVADRSWPLWRPDGADRHVVLTARPCGP